MGAVETSGDHKRWGEVALVSTLRESWMQVWRCNNFNNYENSEQYPKAPKRSLRNESLFATVSPFD